MARINLLPWREAERKQRQREFGVMILSGVMITLAALLSSHLHINGMIDGQNRRNDFLSSEIRKVDKKIKEIKDLEKTKANLIARMNIIQQLQESRPQVVHLFDELVTSVPEGAYLTKVVQAGNSISLNGRAQSNARVSSYMRNIDASEWLGNPRLKVIENKDQTDTGLSHFQLTAHQINKSKSPANSLN